MSKRPLLKDTLAANLGMLLDLVPEMEKRSAAINWLSQKSGVSTRMIRYILNKERTPTIEMVDAVARPFNLTSWQLQIPDLHADIAKNGTIAKLVENFQNASEEGRDYINRVAEHEGKYKNTK